MNWWIMTILVSSIIAPSFAQDGVDFSNIRNPFRIPSIINRVKPRGGPLEEFDVAKFSLVAVITGKRRTRAMVVLPNSKTYYLKLGDLVGINQGVVKAILSRRVLIVEKEKTPLGDLKNIFREITLKGVDPLPDEDLKKLFGQM